MFLCGGVTQDSHICDCLHALSSALCAVPCTCSKPGLQQHQVVALHAPHHTHPTHVHGRTPPRRRRACVKLLCELGLHEDAVALALAVDLELAKAVANGPEDDEALRRKLWLRIAKAVVQVGGVLGSAGCEYDCMQ